ncbi:MAG: OsmC family protein [Candidatus Zixiibacteriota bacterium]
MKINNIDVEKVSQFIEEVKRDPSKAKESKKITGHWNFEAGKPQFESKLEFSSSSEVIYSDQAPFRGGNGIRPDPIQYCLFGLAACYAATFVSIATMEGVDLKELKVAADNQVDLSQSLGLSKNPIVERVKLTVEARTDGAENKLKEIEVMAKDRCPGVFCLSNPIPLETEVKKI